MEKESEDPFQDEESVEKSWDQVYAQKMWGGENSRSSHINGSMKNECFAVQGAFHMHGGGTFGRAALLSELIRGEPLRSMESRSRKCSP